MIVQYVTHFSWLLFRSYRAQPISTTDSDIELGKSKEGDIRFNAGETEKFLEFPLIHDKVDETDEQAKEFFVEIIAASTLPESPPGAYALFKRSRRVTVRIKDDDGGDQTPGMAG